MFPILFLVAQQKGGNSLLTFLPFILIFVVFYVLLVLPQQRKQKEHQKMINQLNKGDRVITSSGIYGTVAAVKDHVISLVIADGVKVEIQKAHISGKVVPQDQSQKS
jgi:preprotein translocase subunit YajC